MQRFKRWYVPSMFLITKRVWCYIVVYRFAGWTPPHFSSRDECCSVGLFLVLEAGNLCRIVVCLSSAWKDMPVLLRGDGDCFGKVISQRVSQCCKNSAIIWVGWRCQLGHGSSSMLCILGLQELNMKC